jgi:transcriptional regulator with XRE-family HTH domain
MTKNPHRATVAQYITIEVNGSGKTQREIAEEAGFPNPNTISMFKTGATRLPLDRVGPLAKALEIDSAYLLRLVMLEYFPETWREVETALKTIVLTANEIELIRAYRRVNGDRDGRVTVVKRDSVLSVVAA